MWVCSRLGVDNVGTGDTNLPAVAAGGHEDMAENGLARCNGTVEIALERGVQIDILRSSVGFTSWECSGRRSVRFGDGDAVW